MHINTAGRCRIKFLLLLLLVFLLFCSGKALAADSFPYSLSRLSLTYSVLDSNSQALWNNLYTAIRQGKNEAQIPSGMSMEDTQQVLTLLSQECNELIALDSGNVTITWKEKKGQKVPLKVNLAYKYSLAAQEAYISFLQDLAGNFQSGDTQTDALTIHDFVCSQIVYMEGSSGRNSSTGQSFYEALSTHQGVCNAYAQGMTVLCHFAGIPCSYLSGYTDQSSSGHAWNIALLDGCYTYYDLTWDDMEETGPVSIYAGIGYDRLYAHRRMDPEISAFALLPKGTELNPLISDADSLGNTLALSVLDDTAQLCLCFTADTYGQWAQDKDYLFNLLAGYGVLCSSLSRYDNGCGIVLLNCERRAVRYFDSKEKLVQLLKQGPLQDGTWPPFVTDLGLFSQLIRNDCEELKQCMMEAGVYGAFSYSSSGIIYF